MFEYYRWNVFRRLNKDLLRDWSVNPPSTFIQLRVSETQSWMLAKDVLEAAEKYSFRIPSKT
jgi:hypothetical protein